MEPVHPTWEAAVGSAHSEDRTGVRRKPQAGCDHGDLWLKIRFRDFATLRSWVVRCISTEGGLALVSFVLGTGEGVELQGKGGSE